MGAPIPHQEDCKEGCKEVGLLEDLREGMQDKC